MVTQYELLVRLRGEDGEVVLPAAFLPVAERFGLVGELDLLVLREALALLAALRRQGRQERLEVNVSPSSFRDEAFLEAVVRQVQAAGVDGAGLVFEVTETAAVTSLVQARRFIETLKSLGCRFGLDDFGVGFSSFHLLKYLPVDYLKIDGVFIRDLGRSRADRHLVRAMVDVARALGKETVAEFVGDEATLALVRDLGVDYAQGYAVGRPAPAAGVLGLAPRQAGAAPQGAGAGGASARGRAEEVAQGDRLPAGGGQGRQQGEEGVRGVAGGVGGGEAHDVPRVDVS